MYMQAKRRERKYIVLAGHDQVAEKGKRLTGRKSEEKRGKREKREKMEKRESRRWRNGMMQWIV